MNKTTIRSSFIMRAFALLYLVFMAGCGDDNPAVDPGDASMGDMPIDVPDFGDEDVAIDLAPDLPVDALCAPCADDSECEGGSCLDLVADGERVCGRDCIIGETGCPDGYFCAQVGTVGGQCVPEDLTCVDRCSQVVCDSGDVCDPFSGDCQRPLRLCETDCVASELCGDGPEDICLSVPNTPDNERICATGCDPEAETSECPADFGCAALDPENDPNRGVCFPMRGTCVDRCGAVDCPDGQNCDPVTGQCSAALYGACEAGCTNSTECLGQDDVCLDLGINDGAHCWQGCEDGVCTDGYECATLVGTSLRVCIPLGRDCSTCYGTDCFPAGVCNPVDSACLPIQADCNEMGCPGGFVCNVASTECQAIDQACSGDSWAVDCDNVKTKCTTQRPGTEGVCAQVCQSDNDCLNGRCLDTSLGNLCLPGDLGGAQACGGLRLDASDVGRPCLPGFCRNAAPLCLTGVQTTPYCSKVCSSNTDCGTGERCGAGPSGGDVCIPIQCECSSYHGLGAEAAVALNDALVASGLGSCSLVFEMSAFDGVADLDLAFMSPFLDRLAAYPLRSLGLRDSMAAAAQATSVTEAIENAALLRDAPVSGNAANYTYPGSESKLTQAMAALISAAGGVADLPALELEAASVPLAAQDVVAPIVSAVAEANVSRASALTAAGWTQVQVDAAFAGMPYTMLPGAAAQLAAAPDLMDPATRALYASFPLTEFSQIAADLSATIEAVLASAPDLSGLVGFGYRVNTPAGLVVIGDAGATTYDPAQDAVLGMAIAVMVELGGDDIYRIPLAANRPGTHTSVAIDLGGDDLYAYVEVADPNDGALLVSDSDGRVPATLPLNQGDGPISASDQGRQGSARVGVAMQWDLGGSEDTYRSLRMSQGAAVLGVGVLLDDGGSDSYEAEAFSQGASNHGIGIAQDLGTENDTYRLWHAGQGFAGGGGVSWLSNQGGNDSYEGVAGASGTVLYFSPTDRGVSNRNLSQGVSVGVSGELAGGLAVLYDGAGDDTYTVGTYGQAHAAYRGVAYLIDANGQDIYEGRGVVQGVAEWGAGALLFDASGNDHYNPTSPRRQLGQGVGQLGSWGVLLDNGGSDEVNYIAPAGGVAVDGGFGAALFEGDVTMHNASSVATWGFAQSAPMMPPFDALPTLGFFVDAGSAIDVYQRSDLTGIGNDQIWRQPSGLIQTGYGTDR